MVATRRWVSGRGQPRRLIITDRAGLAGITATSIVATRSAGAAGSASRSMQCGGSPALTRDRAPSARRRVARAGSGSTPTAPGAHARAGRCRAALQVVRHGGLREPERFDELAVARLAFRSRADQRQHPQPCGIAQGLEHLCHPSCICFCDRRIEQRHAARRGQRDSVIATGPVMPPTLTNVDANGMVHIDGHRCCGTSGARRRVVPERHGR